MTLVPNKPINRLRHIAKEYGKRRGIYLTGSMVDYEESLSLATDDDEADWSTERVGDSVVIYRKIRGREAAATYPRTQCTQDGQIIVINSIAVAYYMMGLDDWFGEVLHHTSLSIQDLLRHPSGPLQFTADELSDVGIGDIFVDLALDRAEKDLPKTSEYDFVLPWAARELWKLVKAIKSAYTTDVPLPGDTLTVVAPDWNDYQDAARALRDKSRAIGQWVKKFGHDLNKMTLAEALEGIADYEEEIDVLQGDEVYRFPDGWTIQNLSAACVPGEGKVMQHCAGDYAEDVEAGEVVILSLRSPVGKPHVTIEIAPVYKIYTWEYDPSWYDNIVDKIMAARMKSAPRVAATDCKFVQIMGKQNDLPVPKYRRYILAFLRDVFPEHVEAALAMALDDEPVDFRGATVRYVSFDEGASNATLLPYRVLNGDWEGATFVSCVFRSMSGKTSSRDGNRIQMLKGSLRNAKFSDCRFESHSHVEFVDVSGSEFVECDISANLARCNLSGVRFSGSAIASHLYYCDLSRVYVWMSRFVVTAWGTLDLREATFDSSRAYKIQLSYPKADNRMDTCLIDITGMSIESTIALLETNQPELVGWKMSREQAEALDWFYVGPYRREIEPMEEGIGYGLYVWDTIPDAMRREGLITDLMVHDLESGTISARDGRPSRRLP